VKQSKNIKIMYYSHNSHGLGHSTRALAILTGIKKQNPNSDILIAAGTGVPHIFLNQGIEIVKLPSIKMTDNPDNSTSLIPRYLKASLSEISELRRRILLDTFDCFKPNVLIVEHAFFGQNAEMLPILMRRWVEDRNHQKRSFATVYISRGIMDSPRRVKSLWKEKTQKGGSIDGTNLFDLVYIMEDKKTINFKKDYQLDKQFCDRAKYLGKITIKTKKELVRPQEIKEYYGIPANEKIILVSLGRWKGIEKILDVLLKTFKEINGKKEYNLLVQIDPFLDKEIIAKHIKNKDSKIKFLDYIPQMIDMINAADLVICRGGYNTIAEILLTNTKAILFPEIGRTEEEPYRVKKASKNKNIVYLDEFNLTKKEFKKKTIQLLKQKKGLPKNNFDKYKIGKTILNDIKKQFNRL